MVHRHRWLGALAARRLPIMIGISLLLLLSAGRASAHAILLETDPGIDEVVKESPEVVTLHFTEPVEVAFGAIRVFDDSGTRVDSGAARHIEGSNDTVEVPLEADLANGTYTVSWRVVSADSHPVSEAFVFHVGAPGAQPTGLAAAALEGESGAPAATGALAGLFRWLNFAGLMLLGGAWFFSVIVWPRKMEDPSRLDEMDADLDGRRRRIVVTTWWMLVVVTLVGIVLQGAVAGGLSIVEATKLDVIGNVLDTRYGVVALVKLGLLQALAVLHLTVLTSGSRRSDAGTWGSGVVVVALLATPGLAGHPGVTDPVWMNVLMDVVHVSAASIWLGGLALLLGGVFPSSRLVDEDARSRVVAPVVARFSDAAFWAVTALVASGTYRSFIEVGAFRALTSTTYGQILLVKLSVFVPLLALGAINNRYIKPRLQRLAEEGAGSARASSLLRRSVGTEVVLGAVVLAVTALLVNVAPARVDAGLEGPFVADVAVDDMNVNVLIDPNQVGENLVHVTATTPAGAPARDLNAVDVRFSMPEEDIGPLVGEGRKLGPGHYVVQGRQLSISGDWTLELVLRTGRFDEFSKKIEVTVNR